MSDPSHSVECPNCHRRIYKAAKVAIAVCTICGLAFGYAYQAYASYKGGVQILQAPAAAYAGTTSISSDAVITMYKDCPETYQVREVPGPGFNSMLAGVAGKTDVSSRGVWIKMPPVAPSKIDVSSSTPITEPYMPGAKKPS